jgi:hypothetical protein
MKTKTTKINAAITSGSSPPHDHNIKGPVLTVVPDDISDADLASKIMYAVKDHSDLSTTVGELLVKAHLRHPTDKAFTAFLETAGGIKLRHAKDLMKWCLDPAALAAHKIKQAKADKEYRDRQKKKAADDAAALKKIEDDAKAAAKAKANDTKVRNMAAGRGLTITRALVKQVATTDKLGKASAEEILERYGVKKVQDLKPEDLAKVREDCKNLLTAYGHTPDPEPTEPPVEEPVEHVLTDDEIAYRKARGKVNTPEEIEAAEKAAADQHAKVAGNVMVKGKVSKATAAKLDNIAAIANHGFDGADSFGRDGADRDARALAGFMDECRASAFLPRLSDDGLVKAADFIMSGEWKTVEDAA